MSPVALVEKLGDSVLTLTERWGRCWIFLGRSLRAIFSRPFRWNLFLRQVSEIGVNSTLVISLIAVFTGAVLAVQADYTLSKFGATAFTGPAVALSLIRELGPVLAALMIIGRAGSAMTAELGIMRITEQVDALRSMAVDPIKYLMAPRILAGVITVPLLTGWFIFIGIIGGFIVSTTLLGASSGTFITQMESAVTSVDIYCGGIKAVVFGLLFGWICCYKGYYSGFGAVGVNRATTQAVVAASVSVLIVDYFLTSILTRVFLN